MGRMAVVALALVVTGAGSSCFKPDLGDGRILCGGGGLCPNGYVCRDRHCYRSTDGSDDMSAADDLAAGGRADLAGGDLSGDVRDLSRDVRDLTAAANVDMASIGGCQTGVARVCLDSTTSAVCVNNAPVADRVCPPDSTCAAGHCQPPPGGTACIRNNECAAGTFCVGYGDTGTIHGVCTAPVPGAGGGESAACAAPGYDNSCLAGLCVRTNQGALVCLFACRMPVDCPVGAGQTATCQGINQPATLEGVTLTTARVCVVQ
jgi:hypothetical protein